MTTEDSATKKYDRQIRTIGSEAQRWIHQNSVCIHSTRSKYEILHAELEKNLTLLGFQSLRFENTTEDDEQISIEFEGIGAKKLECSLKIPSQDIKISCLSQESDKEELASFKGVCTQRHMDFTKNPFIFEMMLANITLQHLLRIITKVACQ